MFPTITIDHRVKTGSQSGFRAEYRDMFGNTPLHAAVCRGDADFAESLIRLGADVNSRDGAGATPLHQAVMAGDYRIASVLLDSGADTMVETDHGVSPLQLARVFGRLSDPAWRAILQ